MSKKDENILEQHPEVKNNAQDYFFYEKQPVIEEVVNRGDSREKETQAYEITDDDMEKLAKFALNCVDKDLLEDNRVAAVNSAVSMAIGSMDEGKWQSKVSASTSTLLADMVDKLLTPSEEKKVEEKEDQNMEFTNKNGQTPDEMSKMAAEAAPVAPPKKGVVVKLKPSGRAQQQSSGQTNKAVSQMSGRQRATVKKMLSKGDTVILSSILGQLDKVAGSIQDAGMEALAAKLDAVANTLEKESFFSPGTGPSDQPGEENRPSNPDDTDIQKNFPWLIQLIEEWHKAGAGWEPNPTAKKIQKEFLLNPANRDMFKNLWNPQDYERATRLVNSILDTKNYYEELMKLIESHKDAPMGKAEA